MSVIDEIKNDAAGLMLLRDWIGDDAVTVDTSKAEFRSEVCQTCNHNVAPNWWENQKMHVAEVIRSQLEIKKKMKLRVLGEDKLHMCRVCGCCIALKIHVPIEHIKAHTPKETAMRFPPWCWIRKELYA